ncbi:2,3-bisphosphoglycerate-independent phosphoglycerate mutase [Peptoniphilus equinus]|uniref:2,3-bisphosphoglycerate-independent phosphoglycerate mutase n=1 Tax=Peptoniphilus equinus TaxID=3016343 RepID=A0ABY7QSP7_9FIRM|nr:2,3-bisphosphoglycerate-independent phosphoglycerate mutase [Peptoniphilus equinus]WBW49818.1 2,3-bisphosphoglycerate-independent phosphoglycerate mutase [Peptoniphilus equinus]
MKPVMLIVLDGFGMAKAGEGNAVSLANMPVLDSLGAPKAQLLASGEAVGLPAGQMGNSEVGHLNIGAGRVMFQDLSRINQEIQSGAFFENPMLNSAVAHAIDNDKALHLVGLVSHGGVHSHMDHLKAMLQLAHDKGVSKVYVHAILDGRDVAIDSGIKDLAELENYMHELGTGVIATVGGRYYAMDRDKRWERTLRYYKLLTRGEGLSYPSVRDLVQQSYDKDIYDEFVLPAKVEDVAIEDGDSVVFFNFRPDRMRQIVRLLTEPEVDVERGVFPLIYAYTMTGYDDTFTQTNIIYDKFQPTNTIGEVLAAHGKHQLRIAETEKYAHVTFFLNGGREEPYPGEDRILVPSPKVATYDLKPEMSAEELTEKLVPVLGDYDFIMLNFANPDMVGHTGVIPAAVKALETVDTCLGEILKELKMLGGVALITADHGNCERMMDENGEPVTSHTTNPVPLYMVGDSRGLKDGALCDLAPTVLDLMDVEQPYEMTGQSLLED